MDKKEDLNLDTSPYPLIYVSVKKSDPGTILGLNSLFTTFFGY